MSDWLYFLDEKWLTLGKHRVAQQNQLNYFRTLDCKDIHWTKNSV